MKGWSASSKQQGRQWAPTHELQFFQQAQKASGWG